MRFIAASMMIRKIMLTMHVLLRFLFEREAHVSKIKGYHVAEHFRLRVSEQQLYEQTLQKSNRESLIHPIKSVRSRRWSVLKIHRISPRYLQNTRVSALRSTGIKCRVFDLKSRCLFSPQQILYQKHAIIVWLPHVSASTLSFAQVNKGVFVSLYKY